MTTRAVEIVGALRAVCGDVRPDEPLHRHVSFRIGGPADVLAVPRSLDELRAVATCCFERRIPFIVLGAGSNVLISDRGIRSVVVKVGKGPDRFRIDGSTITAQAGVGLPKMAQEAAKRGLSGLEFAAGIPGSIGGAVVMNAGAHGHAMAEVVRRLRVVTPEGVRQYDAADLGYAYRTSVLQARPAVVLEAQLRLVPADPWTVRRRTWEWLRQRGETQPIGPPSSGCIFRNPAGDHAGRLIDLAGGKGLRVGGAEVSALHANYILNAGGATAGDVCRVIDKVSALVMEKFGIHLEPEIKLLGEFESAT